MSTRTRHGALRYALRTGVTCLIMPNGAVLLNPPHNRKLTGLSTGARDALKLLNQGPAPLSRLDPEPGGEVAGLLSGLAGEGWLATTVLDADRDLYTLDPFSAPPPRPAGPAPAPGALSKFSILRPDTGGFVLEHPRSWCDLRITDPRILAVLGGQDATAAGLAPEILDQLAADLHWGGFTADPARESGRFTTRSWSAPDLWFHRRSTLGPRTITWEHFGPTKWAKGQFPQPDARKPAYPGTPIPLPVPDLTALRAADPSLTTVLEDRTSCRDYDDGAPITLDQLAELLYRTARTREVKPVGPGEELLSRPYPSGGGVYELEVYPVVRTAAGLDAGMYHYDSFRHALHRIAEPDSAEVHRLLKSASATLVGGAEPQVVLLLAARAGRVMWTYEQVAYASILKHVGVLMQTVYLAGTAMGLGVCAQGFSDTAAFVAAAGVDELEECGVGSIVVGTPARS
ncbi:SagB family peptide dehydrogenase [Nocardia sp. CA-290969]|uniref:SagB family peptide dehydrogenase n=1 Tax=Nocardia sp. CA-290969 TaxID=3239986 RepID=UPI003D943B6B